MLIIIKLYAIHLLINIILVFYLKDVAVFHQIGDSLIYREKKYCVDLCIQRPSFQDVR